jgi:hypothetical protein
LFPQVELVYNFSCPCTHLLWSPLSSPELSSGHQGDILVSFPSIICSNCTSNRSNNGAKYGSACNSTSTWDTKNREGQFPKKNWNKKTKRPVSKSFHKASRLFLPILKNVCLH